MSVSYTKPTWQNNQGASINAARLQAISDALDGLVNSTSKAVSNVSFDAEGETMTITYADGSIRTVPNAMVGPQGPRGPQGLPGGLVASGNGTVYNPTTGAVDLSSQVTQKLSAIDENITDGFLKSKNLFDKRKSADVHGTYDGWIVNPNAETVTFSIVDKDTSIAIPSGAYLMASPNGTLGYDKALIESGVVSATTYTGTSKYLSVYPPSYAETLFKKYDIQVEKGSVATTYQPYYDSNKTLTDKISGMSNPNLIENSWFTINSKGKSSYTKADGICIDNWIIHGGTLEVSSNGITITKDSDGGFIRQWLNKNVIYKNRPITYSVNVNGTIYSLTYTVSAQSYYQLNFGNSGVALGIDFVEANPYTYLINLTDSPITIRAFKMEFGTESTLANDSINNGGFTIGKVSDELSTVTTNSITCDNSKGTISINKFGKVVVCNWTFMGDGAAMSWATLTTLSSEYRPISGVVVPLICPSRGTIITNNTITINSNGTIGISGSFTPESSIYYGFSATWLTK